MNVGVNTSWTTGVARGPKPKDVTDIRYEAPAHLTGWRWTK